MATRKVYVNVITRLIIEIEEGVDVGEVISEMDCDFSIGGGSLDEKADIIDTEIRDYEVIDSK